MTRMNWKASGERLAARRAAVTEASKNRVESIVRAAERKLAPELGDLTQPKKVRKPRKPRKPTKPRVPQKQREVRKYEAWVQSLRDRDARSKNPIVNIATASISVPEATPANEAGRAYAQYRAEMERQGREPVPSGAWICKWWQRQERRKQRKQSAMEGQK
jgi:hypothetical protein